MKFLLFVLMSMLVAASQAIAFSTIATVTLTLVSLHKPVDCFFGIFRRRTSPPVQEVAQPEPQSFFQRPQQGGFFNPFGGGGGFGGGNMFFPGAFNAPSFGMFGQNRFPPQFKPPQPMMQQGQRPQIPVQAGFPQPPRQQQQFPPQMFPPQQIPPQKFQPQQFPPESEFEDEFNDPRGDDIPGMNNEEAESFFTLLSETDESKCITRMVCEMGANPENGGEFGQTIAEIIGSLKDFPEGSKVSEYNEVLNIGVAEGLSACLSRFSMCDEESYQLVKKAQVDDEGQSK